MAYFERGKRASTGSPTALRDLNEQRVEPLQVRGRNSDTTHLHRRAIVAEHGDECLGDRGLRGVTSRLGEEASGGEPLDQPERVIPWEAVLLGNLVERDECGHSGFVSNRVDFLAHHCIDEQRSEFLFLLSSERLLRTGDTDNRHRCFPFVLTFRLHERAFHNAKAHPEGVWATPQLTHLALSGPSIRKKRHASVMSSAMN